MKNGLPFISIIMSVYNSERYLSVAIDSILNQTYKNFEFIIINDGSTDNTLSMLTKYKEKDNRIILINRENRGLTYSLNEGINIAKGEYIARMDADDIALPSRLKKQINLMEEKQLDICGSHFFIMNKYGKIVDCSIVPIERNSFLNYLCITTPFAHPSVMIRKSFMTQYQLYYGKSQYRSAEDYALWIEFWKVGAKFGNVDDFLLKYREFKDSLSKLNRKKIKHDRQEISKEFILKNQEQIFLNYEKFNLIFLSKREQELIAMTILILLKYNFKFKYFTYFKYFNKRALLFAIINFFRIGY